MTIRIRKVAPKCVSTLAIALFLTAGLLTLLRSPAAQAGPLQVPGTPSPLVINEILADPPIDISGDANGDGVRDAEQDEFVELVNASGSDVDISGWTLSDAVGPRHVFPAGTVVKDGCAIVIFGGGVPTGPFGDSLVQTASSGLLGLNNSGDSVTLLDGSAMTVTTYAYGSEGGNNQSITRFPDVTGPEPLVAHSTITDANGALFSPGIRVNGFGFDGCATALAVSKSAIPSATVGSRLVYTLSVHNGLAQPLTDVVISDTVPSHTVLAGVEDGGQSSGVKPGSVVTWSVPSVRPGEDIQVRLAVTVAGTVSAVVNSGYGVFAGDFPTFTAGTPITTLVAAPLSIHDIQGAAHLSPMVGQSVSQVPGIVTAVRSNGIYVQEPNPDQDIATAEGIFVYSPGSFNVNVGDLVLINGTVTEFYSGGESRNGVATTELTSPTVHILSTGNALPQPVILGTGGRMPPDQVIDDDMAGNVETGGSFDAQTDGIDFYESLEGMLVQVNNAQVVGPTRFGEFQVVADGGANANVLSSRGALVIRPGDFNPERIFIDDTLVSKEPNVDVGDFFTQPITGVVDYGFGNYKVFNTMPLPPVVPGNLISETTPLTGAGQRLSVATFNMENLDPGDGPDKFNGLAVQIVHNLGNPDIIGLEEVQDNNGPVNDTIVDASQTYSMLLAAIQGAGGPVYDYREIAPEDGADGGEPGGNIRVAFLFRPDRVTFVDRGSAGPTDAVTVTNTISGPVLSASPGRIDPTNSAWSRSRKPLAGEFLFQGETIFVIVNHFNSKGSDDPLFGRIQPPNFNSQNKRTEQARVVNNFVKAILAIDPAANVIVVGDLNEYYFAPPLTTLKGNELTDLVESLPVNERYTFVYQGNAQTLDHILVSPNLKSRHLPAVDIVHVNAEFNVTTGHRYTDHDPVVATLEFAPLTFLYLPYITR